MAQDLTIWARYINAGSSSNQIYQDCINAGSSSQDAIETAYPTNPSRTHGNIYLSSATSVKTYSTASYEILNPTTSNKTGSMVTHLMIPANQSLDGNIDGRFTTLAYDAGTLDKTFTSVTASAFTTTRTNGDVLTIGDDARIIDTNLSNGIGIKGIQAPTKGWIKFGSSGPLVGYNNTDAFPAANDGLYSVTGSMLIKTNKLYFFNGGASNNGWSQII